MKKLILLTYSCCVFFSCGTETPEADIIPNDDTVLQQMQDDYDAIIKSGDGTTTKVKNG